MSHPIGPNQILAGFAADFAREGFGIERQLRITYQLEASDSNRDPIVMQGYIRHTLHDNPEYFLIPPSTGVPNYDLMLRPQYIRRLEMTHDNGRTWKTLWKRDEE